MRWVHSYSQAGAKGTYRIMSSVTDWCSLVKACVNHTPSLTGLINVVLRTKSKPLSAVSHIPRGAFSTFDLSFPSWSAEMSFRFISTWMKGKGTWKKNHVNIEWLSTMEFSAPAKNPSSFPGHGAHPLCVLHVGTLSSRSEHKFYFC